jgi:hypothetical protein
MNVEADELGYSMAERVFTPRDAEMMIAQLGAVLGAGRRGMLRDPMVAQLAHSEPLMELAQSKLDQRPQPIRAIYFDKSPEQNWLVPWHQDLTIAVSHQLDIEGFGPWSEKDGITHVQPPIQMLEHMITLRIHLDDTDESNGALRVQPRSHRHGRLGAAEIETWRRGQAAVTCHAGIGDILLMRPLILHSSGRSSSLRHRRILHIEYAGYSLPDGLKWNEDA